MKDITPFLIISLILSFCSLPKNETKEIIAKEVLERTIGKELSSRFHFQYEANDSLDYSKINVKDNSVVVVGNSVIALTRGAYDYLRNHTSSIVSWSGNRIDMPDKLNKCDTIIRSPFKFRYYMNVVTHGYTTPYWDWNRWEKEIDWMALHGMNMPLIPGAHEAILMRTFKKLGLTEEEILNYFSGPAHLPWNRMGNITGWDGAMPTSFLDKQVDLTHKIIDRLNDLDMFYIVPAFAGFIPSELCQLFPNENVRELGWCGFDKKVKILNPKSDLFQVIGKLYIEEWEKEFGKGKFYLADSFNEMNVPLSKNDNEAYKELSSYGESVYNPIKEINPDAVWVMQGWTFPYYKDSTGKRFWTKDKLNALISKVPNDKALVLDLANDYNKLIWKIDYSWKIYDGFFGKQWVYSFIPNMGGKVPLNGVLDFYAKAPQEAIDNSDTNLVGFGFAPEGIENNEIIYELLSDWGWRTKAIDLKKWIPNYCKSRYGSSCDEIINAYDLLRKSCYGKFYDAPRFKYQFRPMQDYPSVNDSPEFFLAVKKFLNCSEKYKNEPLYIVDAIELSAQYLQLKADEMLESYLNDEKNDEVFNEAMLLLKNVDKILGSHPNHSLNRWIKFAREMGDNKLESDYYESNAKRLITTWGGNVNEYAARTWNGLICDYYVKRWEEWHEAKVNKGKFEIKKWEENWIKKPYLKNEDRLSDPLILAKKLVNKY
ncbi:alpha-N-acetylglucosaminidase [Marinilabiliaceae bacterium JC017]|nr:alpha-N-acetylglucosaminidase [Marinilabiliaceae bacterium JC017]